MVCLLLDHTSYNPLSPLLHTSHTGLLVAQACPVLSLLQTLTLAASRWWNFLQPGVSRASFSTYSGLWSMPLSQKDSPDQLVKLVPPRAPSPPRPCHSSPLTYCLSFQPKEGQVNQWLAHCRSLCIHSIYDAPSMCSILRKHLLSEWILLPPDRQ